MLDYDYNAMWQQTWRELSYSHVNELSEKQLQEATSQKLPEPDEKLGQQINSIPVTSQEDSVTLSEEYLSVKNGTAPDWFIDQVNGDLLPGTFSIYKTPTTFPSYLERKQQYYYEKYLVDFSVQLEEEVQNTMQELEENLPGISEKTFDFVNTGGRLEVVEHNLTDEELTLVTEILNNNSKLKEASGFFNYAAAHHLNTQNGQFADTYQKEDFAGQIEIRDLLVESRARSKRVSHGDQDRLNHNLSDEGLAQSALWYAVTRSEVPEREPVVDVSDDERKNSWFPPENPRLKQKPEVDETFYQTPQAGEVIRTKTLDRLPRTQEMMETVKREWESLMDRVAKERPHLADQWFDITNTGNELDVVDHNLSKSDYQYLKQLANSNKDLVEATEYLNWAIADNMKPPEDDKYYQFTDLDAAGRFKPREVFFAIEEDVLKETKRMLQDPLVEKYEESEESKTRRAISKLYALS